MGPGLLPGDRSTSSTVTTAPPRPDDEVQILELPINRGGVLEADSGVVQRFGARMVDGHWRMEAGVEQVEDLSVGYG